MPDLRPTKPVAAAKLAHRVRARGLGEIADLVAGRARELYVSASTLIVLTRPTAGTQEVREDLTFRRAGAADAPAYARAIGTDSAATFQRRIAAPDVDCYLAADTGGDLVHASWVTTTAAWTRELRAYVCPPGGGAYIYESFTRPDARGRGIYPFVLRSICAELARDGVDTAWIAVEEANVPSVRAITKAGFEEAFRLRFGRTRGRFWMDPPAGPRADLARAMVLSGGGSPA